MTTTRCKLFTDTVLNNLLDAQKNMASAEKVDARGLIRLSRFILRLLEQLDDEVVELASEAEDERGTALRVQHTPSQMAKVLQLARIPCTDTEQKEE